MHSMSTPKGHNLHHYPTEVNEGSWISWQALHCTCTCWTCGSWSCWVRMGESGRTSCSQSPSGL